jgi:hypothetical protein
VWEKVSEMNSVGTPLPTAVNVTTRSGLKGGRTGEQDREEGRRILLRSGSGLREWIWTFITVALTATVAEVRHLSFSLVS